LIYLKKILKNLLRSNKLCLFRQKQTCLFRVLEKQTCLFIVILFLLGLGLRLFLIFSLPLWQDEAFSVWVIQFPFLKILTGVLDPTHPPGYYFFLKLWSLVSGHLFWLRASSLFFFTINIFLLGKIGLALKKGPIFSLILVFLYIFSGYFVIFDWQVRMYAGVVTLILASLFFLLKENLLFFIIVNLIGLYFDYGFLWYLVPLFFFVLFQVIIKKNTHQRKVLFSLISSVILFLPWLPSLLRYYQSGIEGIAWTKFSLSPSFFVPYFLGSHTNKVFLLPLLMMAIFGLYLLGRERKSMVIFQITLFSALFSTVFAFLFSVLVSPIFHTRSLQIVGINLLFLFGLTLHWLYQKGQHYLFFGVVLLILVNFFFVVRLFFQQPSYLLLNFFPWK